MSIDQTEIAKLARLARIDVSAEQSAALGQRIGDILKMVDVMQAINTDHIDAMANPHDAVQRLRKDTVSETNQRDAFQEIAPLTEDGLYLVPQVIE